jgi:hypothetical protein
MVERSREGKIEANDRRREIEGKIFGPIPWFSKRIPSHGLSLSFLRVKRMLASPEDRIG